MGSTLQAKVAYARLNYVSQAASMVKRVGFLVVLSVWTTLVFAMDACHPSVGVGDFVVGYGSLMSLASTMRTVPSASSRFPVMINGFSRDFSAHVDIFGLGIAFLAAQKADKDAMLNGVMMRVSPEDAKALDAREAVYCRVEVPISALHAYGDRSLPVRKGDRVWIYVQDAGKQSYTYPDAHYKLVQSYVDEFLGGCIAVSEEFGASDFASDCVKLTLGWKDRALINDRIYPRRPWVYQPRALAIDRLMQAIIPDVLRARKLKS